MSCSQYSKSGSGGSTRGDLPPHYLHLRPLDSVCWQPEPARLPTRIRHGAGQPLGEPSGLMPVAMERIGVLEEQVCDVAGFIPSPGTHPFASCTLVLGHPLHGASLTKVAVW